MTSSLEPQSKKARTDASELSTPGDAEVQDPIRLFDAQADLQVLVEGETVRVHAAQLGLASPVFAAMLTSNMREGLSYRIELPDKSKEEFMMFMTFLRPVSRVHVTVENVDQMLPWFDEYQIATLKEDCESLLLTLPVTSERLLQAYKFDLEKLYSYCLKNFTSEQLLFDFEKFVKEPSVLRDVMPIAEEKTPKVRHVFFLIRSLLDASVPLESAMPVLKLCLNNAEFVDKSFAEELLQLLSDSSDTVPAITLLVGRIFKNKAQEVSQITNIEAGLLAISWISGCNARISSIRNFFQHHVRTF
eukprot:gnl/MRDRNA2_/MRDRNA2_162540_c0_seq1.p1 gnl/MRDRNA2_/MRDRNA2_162540_c0~~gnl/MRDRNA2_/MRDRNA2_162540_c0_seq1.p1  ORF type:complete len:303 (+),score=56.65 gnl/MRDRNA2_/MRDRNA2_162540_c0_seq1:86-994(+)